MVLRNGLHRLSYLPPETIKRALGETEGLKYNPPSNEAKDQIADFPAFPGSAAAWLWGIYRNRSGLHNFQLAAEKSIGG
jgi:hypothetical protein